MSEVSTVLENSKLVTFKDLTGFVERHARMEQSFLWQLSLSAKMIRSMIMIADKNRYVRRRSLQPFQKQKNKTPAQQTPSCAECKKNHVIWRCPVFQKLLVRNCWKSMKLNRLCFKCFGRHILFKMYNCKSNGKCRKCGRRHHTMLHSDNVSGTSIGSGNSSDSAEMVEQQHGTCASGKITGIAGSKLCLKVVSVIVWAVGCYTTSLCDYLCLFGQRFRRYLMHAKACRAVQSKGNQALLLYGNYQWN